MNRDDEIDRLRRDLDAEIREARRARRDLDDVLRRLGEMEGHKPKPIPPAPASANLADFDG